MQKPILIVGGQGKTGSRVAKRLSAQGVATRMASRSTGFDWTDGSSWAAALDGVAAAYVTYYPDLAAKGAPEAIGDFAALAVSLGVKRLVLLSGRGEPEAQASEQRLIATGADWTVVRASWFNQNFDEGQLAPLVLAGEVALPVDTVREPFVDAEDIADVVAAALADPRHIGEIYEVTGPRLLSFAEAIAAINRAAGLSVVYRTIRGADFVEGLTRSGLEPKLVALLEDLFTVVLDGRNEWLADGVERALGRPPRDFETFAADAAARGAWRA